MFDEQQFGWQDDALCAQTDPELFFPDGSAPYGLPARKVCGACPVRAQCLAFALEEEIGYGVFGGLTAVERRHLLSAARRAS